MQSQEIIQKYLLKNGINIDVKKYIKLIDPISTKTFLLEDKLIDSIIVDAYNGFSKSVKVISDILIKNYTLYLGRKEKKIIKKVLDYKTYESLKKLKTTKR